MKPCFTDMNTLMMQMRHTAHELRVTLDNVRHGGDAEFPTQSNDINETISFITDNETETRLSHHIPEVSVRVVGFLPSRSVLS